MPNSLFDFLQELEPELVDIGSSIEKIFYEDPHGVLVKSRLFAELMTKKVAEREDFLHILDWRQVDRLQFLDNNGLLTKDIARAFDTIRLIGNKASHEGLNNDLELALKIHRNLYKISVWFFEIYGNYNSKAPKYRYPEMKKNEEIDKESLTKLIETALANKLPNLLQNQKVILNNQSHVQTESSQPEKLNREEIENKDFDIIEDKQLHNSYLLYQLSKLRESSQEAVEGSNSLSTFKEYLHINRPIQEELINALNEAKNSDSSELILLCGSVGDGKSHLLAYMNQTYQELMEGVHIHNDATESFDPQKNSLDTLAEVLINFSDENIEISNEKRILAINLGVLHNFLESDYAKNSYTKLASFIKKSKIFETEYLSENYYDKHFKLISFSDYHPYELTEDGPKSEYFTKLLEKIVQPLDNNPFYIAYQRDIKNKVRGAFIKNYQLLQNESIRNKVSDLLIQTIIKYKHLISTRAFLNFIYDIIVPANIDEEQFSSSVIEETEVLLPNLIFNSTDRSTLLKMISQNDPINIRSEKIDEILIQLNNSNNITDIFKKHLEFKVIEDWINQLTDLGPFYELTSSTKQLLSATLIRFSYFLGKNIQDVYIDSTYKSYMEYLYKYNIGHGPGLRQLYDEIKDAVFAWNGQPKENSTYIFLEENSVNMKLAQSLNISRYAKHLEKRESDLGNRFKNSILIGFQNESKDDYELLEIDYQLYKLILKVINGYRPNKKDKEDAIQFIEFIDRLIKLSSKENVLTVYDNSVNILFKLEYDEDFEEFIFKRD